jgi:hypothetical protein
MYICGLDNSARQENTASTAATPKAQPSPTLDKNVLRDQLVAIENALTEASLNGDVSLLARSTTDDFELTGVNGKVQDKNAALRDVKKEKNIKSWSITDTDLQSFSEDTAVLRYIQNVTLKTGHSGRARVTDTFVKKGNEWLIKSEQQTLIK